MWLKNADDANFCVKCGKKLTKVETLASPSSEPDKPSDQTLRDSGARVSTEIKYSPAVTILSAIGIVFGLFGMLGSFMPSIGPLVFYVGIPATIVSAIGLAIAYSQNAKKTFAILAVAISLIGVLISGWQYFSNQYKHPSK
jgi:hypothetical protein